MVQLERMDIAIEVSAMALMLALPMEGHLEAVFQTFAFLKSKHNGVMVFDPTVPDIDKTQFPREDWSATPYGDCQEEVPPNASAHLGIKFTIRGFIDIDHAGNIITC